MSKELAASVRAAMIATQVLGDEAERAAINAYHNGLIEGVRRFSHWRDGIQYVGTCGSTLAAELAGIEQERRMALASMSLLERVKEPS